MVVCETGKDLRMQCSQCSSKRAATSCSASRRPSVPGTRSSADTHVTWRNAPCRLCLSLSYNSLSFRTKPNAYLRMSMATRHLQHAHSPASRSTDVLLRRYVSTASSSPLELLEPRQLPADQLLSHDASLTVS